MPRTKHESSMAVFLLMVRHGILSISFLPVSACRLRALAQLGTIEKSRGPVLIGPGLESKMLDVMPAMLFKVDPAAAIHALTSLLDE